ncbi:MAG: alpha/beta hydrolase [Siculibacillus sp.]|nr:alpha/beta hydrolase [Siculibacillus sp.]
MGTSEERITVGEGAAAREIAVIRRAGAEPGLFWLGGFRSDMAGTKALALDDFGRERGLAVTRFDYSGHGLSGGSFEEGTISRWLEEALAVFETTRGPQVVIGSSMGGWIALLLTRAHRERVGRAASRAKAMVLIAPAPDFTEDLMWAGFSEEIRRGILATGRHEEPSEYSEEPYVVTRALIEDGRRNLVLGGEIDLGCPVTILQGVKDTSVPWRHAVRLTTHLTRDDVTLTLIPDGDHRLSRPQDIARLETVIAGHLA